MLRRRSPATPSNCDSDSDMDVDMDMRSVSSQSSSARVLRPAAEILIKINQLNVGFMLNAHDSHGAEEAQELKMHMALLGKDM